MLSKFFRFPFATAGDKTAVPDPVVGTGEVSYTQGYGPDYQLPKTNPQAKDIERAKMNQVLFDVTTALQEYQTNGVPDWIDPAQNGGAAFAYPAGARVRYTNGLIYRSAVAANNGTPSVSTNWVLDAGQLLNIQVLTVSGTFTRTPGARSGRLRAIGGGSGGGSVAGTGAGQVSVAAGGQCGADGEHWFNGNLPASQLFTIGAGSFAGGAAGATVFGALSCPGGAATGTAAAGTPPVLIGANNVISTSTGFNIRNGRTGPGAFALAVGLGGFVSGGGAATQFGPGAAPNVTGGAPGTAALNYGAGGAGASVGQSSAGQAGGKGQDGVIIIEEFS